MLAAFLLGALPFALATDSSPERRRVAQPRNDLRAVETCVELRRCVEPQGSDLRAAPTISPLRCADVLRHARARLDLRPPIADLLPPTRRCRSLHESGRNRE